MNETHVGIVYEGSGAVVRPQARVDFARGVRLIMAPVGDGVVLRVPVHVSRVMAISLHPWTHELIEGTLAG